MTSEQKKSNRPAKAIWGGFFLVLAICLGAVIWYESKAPELKVNKMPSSYTVLSKMESEGMPDFELPDLDGKPYKLSEHYGNITIVNFWASWCAPCVEEFPSMIKLLETMKGEVKIIAVSADSEEADLRNFLKAFGMPKPGFDVVWDKDSKVRQVYGVEKVPESFIVGKDRKLVRKVLGIDNWSEPGAIEYFRNLVAGKNPRGY